MMLVIRSKQNNIGWFALLLMSLSLHFFLFVLDPWLGLDIEMRFVGDSARSIWDIVLSTLFLMMPLFVLVLWMFCFAKTRHKKIILNKYRIAFVRWRSVIVVDKDRIQTLGISSFWRSVYLNFNNTRIRFFFISRNDLKLLKNEFKEFNVKISLHSIFTYLNSIVLIGVIYVCGVLWVNTFKEAIVLNKSVAVSKIVKVMPHLDFCWKVHNADGSIEELSILGWAAFVNSYEISNILVKSGAPVNKGNTSTGDTPLLISILNNNMKTALQLLIDGASPLIENKKGQSVCTMLRADQKKFEKDYKKIYPLVYVRCLEGKK